MVPNELITLIYQYKTSLLTHHVNCEIRNLGCKRNKPHVITLTPANRDNPSIGVIYNTHNISGRAYDNHVLKREIFFNYTYFCDKCGDWLRYEPTIDSFSCGCDKYSITRF